MFVAPCLSPPCPSSRVCRPHVCRPRVCHPCARRLHFRPPRSGPVVGPLSLGLGSSRRSLYINHTVLVKERKKRKERKTNLQAQEVLPTSPAPPVWSPLQLRCHGRPLSFLPSLWLPPLLLAASLVLSCGLPSFRVIPLGLHGYRMRTAAVVHRAVHRKFAGDNSI